MGARRELGQPRTQTGRLLRARLQDGTRPLHEKSSQVRVPAFADPEQSLLAGGGIFARESAAAPQQIRERLLKAGENYWARQVEIQELAVRAWAALAEGKKEEALRQMKSAAELEDGTQKSAVTPGPLAPARELLGEMLLEMNEPAQALEQFEATLKKEPGRFRALYGAAHAAQLSGSRDTSQRYFREMLKVCGHADKPGRSEVREAERAILQG